MIFLLFTQICLADPVVTATLAADGHYTIRIVPDLSWASAELQVLGGETADIGPVKAGDAIAVEGWTDEQQSLRLTLSAAGTDGKGSMWMFEVEPFRVPAQTPALTPRKKRWPFKKKGG